ncbi:MAG: two-component system nitrogen regulation sensor histidine kinase NtrY, partial [Myxococcota bacterium]
ADGDRDLGLQPGRRDEIGELIDAFEAMTTELTDSEERLRRAERVAAWQDIARELAHEIKNPLTPIRMAIETVRRTYKRKHPRFEEVFEESTATILEEVDRLKDIVSEFSQFARMPRPSPQAVRLNDLVHQAVVLYREDDTITLTETLDSDLGEQQLDPSKMTQVIQNLLKNAIQATAGEDRPGKVTISTRRLQAGSELIVTDNGCGISEENLRRVFTPYFTGKVGGTGLGLAVVHRIISDHDGRVGVSSTVGEGTRFVVQLPNQPRAEAS